MPRSFGVLRWDFVPIFRPELCVLQVMGLLNRGVGDTWTYEKFRVEDKMMTKDFVFSVKIVANVTETKNSFIIKHVITKDFYIYYF